MNRLKIWWEKFGEKNLAIPRIKGTVENLFFVSFSDIFFQNWRGQVSWNFILLGSYYKIHAGGFSNPLIDRKFDLIKLGLANFQKPNFQNTTKNNTLQSPYSRNRHFIFSPNLKMVNTVTSINYTGYTGRT